MRRHVEGTERDRWDVAQRRMLICLISLADGAKLVLDHAVVVEKGSRYWLDRDRRLLVIKRPDGSTRTVPGQIDESIPGPRC